MIPMFICAAVKRSTPLVPGPRVTAGGCSAGAAGGSTAGARLFAGDRHFNAAAGPAGDRVHAGAPPSPCRRASDAVLSWTPMAARLPHTDGRGQVHMVDVGTKPETARLATASAAVRMSSGTLDMVLGGGGSAAPKGDVLATARIAAIAALKRTADWIPLCHPVRVVGTEVALEPPTALPGITVRVTVRAFDRTGVEMEAMVGASAAALTIYD